jgi:DNA-binding beta-propeller fold protein YncE
MNRLFIRFAALVYVALLFVGCESDPTTSPAAQDTTYLGQHGRAIFVANEGNYGGANATIDVLVLRRENLSDAYDTTYQKNRIAGLGDVANDIKIINGKLYAVMNGSNQIVVADPATATELKRIDFALGSGSNKIAKIAADRALVTHLSGTELSIIDLNTDQIAGTLNLNRTSVDIGVLNNKAFISADTQSVVIWDLATNSIQDVVEVPYAPQQIFVDSVNNQIVVACQGDWRNTASNTYLVWINALTGEVTKTDQIGTGTFQIGRLFAGNGKLYLTSGSQVKSIDLASRAISSMPFITAPGSIYGGAVDPLTGNLYLGDAGSFSAPGKVYVYSGSTGQLLNTYEAGIGPAHFAFYR